MVALRFDSESFAKGDRRKAQTAFVEALELFTLTGNQKGIGSSQNNLAACELALGNVTEAEKFYKLAIQNAESMLQSKMSQGAAASDIDRMSRVLSDRKGNLAIVYLQQDRFTDAFSLLESLLAEDKRNAYIRGLVVKQGTLGHFYLKQGETNSAEQVFQNALTFIRLRDEDLYGVDWNDDETESSEQIALFNWAILQKVKESSHLESDYLNALCRSRNMHTATTTKILHALNDFFITSNRKEEAKLLQLIAAQCKFDLNLSNGTIDGNRTAAKRVAFVLDYSGSMSGAKIKAAVENIQIIFQNNIHMQDSVLLIAFNSYVTQIIPITRKLGNERMISDKIASLTEPNGGTAFYFAMTESLKILMREPRTRNDWIIALTDGDDSETTNCTAYTVKYILQSAEVGVVIIGVGRDVKSEVLESIALSVPNGRGSYVFAEGDRSSIDKAFGEAADLMEGNVVMEDI